MEYVEKKKVTVIPLNGAIRNVKPPISARITKMLPVEDIRACIMGRANVTETLPDGTTIRITLSNYNTNNFTKPEISIAKPEVSKVEKPKAKLVVKKDTPTVEFVSVPEDEELENYAVKPGDILDDDLMGM